MALTVEVILGPKVLTCCIATLQLISIIDSTMFYFHKDFIMRDGDKFLPDIPAILN